MNDDGISFGEVEEAAPEGALRPDKNRHFAVAAYGAAQEQDLPIFVDLDVLLDMEDHAQSDMTVELGGVLLGGHYEDISGQPFVVVTDSLRAQHYESTKGSFKFTHDTWSQITREREQFPAELSMVGWYHTHPDWGVFLSGMDMFICDNFFNKKLDVAYVIDPCRGDRGMFQWTGDPRHRVRRTSGFFVMASRFRAAELEYTVGELSGAMPVTTTTSRGSAAAGHAPVIHLHQPQNPQPPWQGLAIAGALALQLALVALIAFKTLIPPAANGKDDKLAAAVEKLEDSIAGQQSAQLAKERSRAQAEMLDQVVSAIGQGESGGVSKALAQYDQTQRLARDLQSREHEAQALIAKTDGALRRVTELEERGLAASERHAAQVAKLQKANEDLQKSLDEVKAKLVKYEGKTGDEKTAGDKPASASQVWWYVGGAVLAAIVLVGGVWWIGGGRATEPAGEEERVESMEKGEREGGTV